MEVNSILLRGADYSEHNVDSPCRRTGLRTHIETRVEQVGGKDNQPVPHKTESTSS